MKLYTEEQLHKLIIKYRQNLTEFSLSKPSVQNLIDELTPVTLPTEEEVEAFAMGYYNEDGGSHYVSIGAEFVIEKIIKGRVVPPEEIKSKRTFYENYIYSDKNNETKENLD